MGLTPEQAERINQHLPTVANLYKLIVKVSRRPWVKKFFRRTKILPSWHWAYQFSTTELLAFYAILLGCEEDLRRVPQEGYEFLLNSIQDDTTHVALPSPRPHEILLVASVSCALFHTALAIGYHSKTMDVLINEGLSGNALSLRQAIAIDPTALALPGVASRISMLRLQGDKQELRLLFNAANKGPNKSLAPNWQLRYLERILRESNFFETHSREEVYKLVVEKMRLYGTKGDSFKGLNTLFARWRKAATT